MAVMVPNSTVSKSVSSLTASAGQRIVIQVLNADNSVAQSICDDAVPAGVSFRGSLSYNGSLS